MDADPIHVAVNVSAPVDFLGMQWVKVVRRPEYSTRNVHPHVVVRSESVSLVTPPKQAMLYWS